MRRLVETFIRRPVFASMLIATLVVVGIASFLHLRVDRFPSVDVPTVSVRTLLPGASIEEVETLVSQRIEEAVNTVEGIDQLRSISGQGSSFVMITFDLERDIEAAAQDVRERVAGVLRDLPPEVEPPIIGKFDNDQTPVLTFALSGRPAAARADRDRRQDRAPAARALDRRRRSAHRRRARTARSTSGSTRSACRPTGSRSRAVRTALARQNADVPGGNVTDAEHERVLRTMGRVDDPREFDDVVIATLDGQPVRVRDIGRVEDGTKEQRSTARLDGVPVRDARGAAPVGRQHDRGHRRRQGEARPAARRAARRPCASR